MELGKDRLVSMYEFLKDIPVDKLAKGIKKFCMKHREIYPQTNIIAYIREYALIDEDWPTPMEAWMMVTSHIASGAEVPEIVDKAARAIGWRDIRMSETPGVERAHFVKAYEALVAREREKLIMGEA
jgi:hypothetical protein